MDPVQGQNRQKHKETFMKKIITGIILAAVAVTAMLPPAMAIESSIVAWIPTPGVFSLTRLIDTEAPTATPTPGAA